MTAEPTMEPMTESGARRLAAKTQAWAGTLGLKEQYALNAVLWRAQHVSAGNADQDVAGLASDGISR